MDVVEHNRRAWNRKARSGCRWSKPVDHTTIERARMGDWSVLLTPETPVPREWFPDPLADVRILGLAGAGGQQMPIFAAAGAQVTVLDMSEEQLALDRRIAEQESLAVRTVQGDMADLSVFEDGTFDLIFHPVSNCFVPDIRPVWAEAFRVLRAGGLLMSGFLNPVMYIFASEKAEEGIFEVAHSIPYSDLDQLPSEDLAQWLAEEGAVEFGHSLQDQIGGQLAAGFVLTDLYEDGWADKPLARHLPLNMATLALKPTA